MSMAAYRMNSQSYWTRRITRHATLFFIGLVITGIVYFATPPPDVRHRLSMGTAYAGLLFLALSLAIGPWNIVSRRPNPVSFDLRRDIGIWAGLLAVIHTAVGLTVHLRGRMWMYFLKRLHPPRIQDNAFGFANYAGLCAALLLLVLVAISNDLSLRTLGVRRWKSLQRWAYAAFGLTVAHGIAFQVVEKRKLVWVLIFSAWSAAALGMQAWGFSRVKKSPGAVTVARSR